MRSIISSSSDGSETLREAAAADTHHSPVSTLIINRFMLPFLLVKVYGASRTIKNAVILYGFLSLSQQTQINMPCARMQTAHNHRVRRPSNMSGMALATCSRTCEAW